MSPTWPMQDWLSPLATLMLTLYFYLITFEIITEIALNAILSKGTIFYQKLITQNFPDEKWFWMGNYMVPPFSVSQ